MAPDIAGLCWHCGSSLEKVDYGRENTCPACDKYTHVCRNCRFFAPGKPNDCLETIADFVRDKDRPNFCGYFEPSRKATPDSGGKSPDDLLRAAEDLFKLK